MNYFDYEGVLWRPHEDYLGDMYMDGPFCRKADCFFQLAFLSGQYGETRVVCTNPKCKKIYPLPKDPMLLSYDVIAAYEAEKRKGSPVVKLGKAPAVAKQAVETTDYKIQTVVREEKGEQQVVLYIWKKSGAQTPGQKVQMILDISDEEVRFDPKDLPPGEVLAAVKVKFKNSITVKKFE